MIYPWLAPLWKRFLEQLDQNRMAHAILICGPEGSGKRDLSRSMAARLLCLEEGQFACGHCRSCRLLEGGAHPELFTATLLETKKQIGVDQVRELIDTLYLTTTISPRKVVEIFPAEALNAHSANALLKNLEEPTGDAVILLTCSNPNRLPVTLRSRCQKVTVDLPAPDEGAAWLAASTGVSASEADSALQAAGLSPLLAQRMLKEGLLEDYAAVQKGLGESLGKPRSVSLLAGRFADFEPAGIWKWLSLNTAAALRSAVSGESLPWLPEGTRLNQRALAGLQQEADRFRFLSNTGVRQDLLLQEWLIKWSGLTN